jgi:tRNA(Ile)-lysidine synthase
MDDALPAGFAPLPDAPEAGGAVVVALSGGLDSTALLHLLSTQPALRARGLRALHVHHGLHADADRWTGHCEALCAALGVPLRVARVEVVRDAGGGLEAAAREARRRAFADALGAGEVLALAHHRDDQAETFLLRALRASGVDGLAAMRPWQRFAAGWLWRPLLAVPRGELRAWADKHGLQWIEDPSNAELAHDRNYLRHRVLPLLRERWPNVDAAFARSAALAAADGALLVEGDEAALAASRGGDPATLSVPALRALPQARRARVLRRWIEALGLPPLPARGVALVESDLLHAAPDGSAAFAWEDAIVRRWRDLLHAGHRRLPLPAGWRARWDGQVPFALPGGGELRLEGANGFDAPLTVAARVGGERIVLRGRAHSHALKHVLQDLGVPPWRRARLPLLLDAQGRVLAAGDVAFSAGFGAWLRARGARLAWAP